jgi:hypothetical protein
MLLHLADHLQIPHRERNVLLLAAGYAPAYGTRPFSDPALAEVRDMVERLLTSLEPCPALAVDRRWNLLASNQVAAHLLSGVAPELVQQPINVLRASLHPHGLAPRIVNLAQWRGYVLNRLHRDVKLTGDPFLDALLDELQGYSPHEGTDGGKRDTVDDEAIPSVAIPLRLHTEAGVLSFLSTTTVFGSATDVTVAELTIESFLPADEHTRQALRMFEVDAPPAP